MSERSQPNIPVLDVAVGGGNGLYTLTPLTEAAREWFDEHVQSEQWQWLGPALVIDDYRLASSIVDGIQSAGLEVR